MNIHNLIIWRNFIGITSLFAIILPGVILGSLYALRDAWIPIIQLMHFPEIVIAAAVLLQFIVLLFLVCPMLALHFIIRKEKMRNKIKSTM